MGQKKPKVEVTLYYMSIHAGLCQGVIDAIWEIEIGGKVAWTGNKNSNGIINVPAQELFGGVEKEGGVGGHVHVFLGGASQTIPEFVAAKFGRTTATMPAFRNMASVFFTDNDNPVAASDGIGFYWGANNPFIPNFAVGVTHLPTGLGAEHAAIMRMGSAKTSEVVDLDATQDGGGNATAGLANGKTLSGFDASDYIRLTLPTGQTWVAWENHGNPTNDSLHTFRVIKDGDTGDVVTVGDGKDDYANSEAARSAFPGAFLTGASSYTFYIHDTPLADNTGGLSILVESFDRPDANPAHIIYDALTSKLYGAGIPESSIDKPSFQAAAETLWNEQLGLSFKWVLETSVQDFIQEVLDHIDAVLFVDPTTGLLTLKLIRQDYEIADLRVIDQTNAVLTKFERPTSSELVNEIQVTWTDPDTEDDAVTPPIQDLASFEIQGAAVSDSRNFYGVRSERLAMKLGHRELLAAATPLASADLTIDRTEWDIVDGEPFVLNWPELGVSQLIMRVADLDRGEPQETPIRISAVEDVFGFDLAVFEDPPDTKHVDTGELPSAIDYTQALTLPYFFAVNEIDPSISADVEYPEVFAGMLAGQDGVDTARYVLLAETTDTLGNTVFEEVARNTILARGTLDATLAAEASSSLATFPALTQGQGPVVASFVIIGSGADVDIEIAAVSVADPGGAGYTLLRGMLDTVPKKWPAGTPIFVLNDGDIIADASIRSAAATATYKILPITSLGTLAEAFASEIDFTLTARPHLPTRPADVKVNGTGFGTVDHSGGGDLTVTFATRNRLTETSILQSWTNGDVTEEGGQTTTVVVLDSDDNVLAEHDDVSSPFVVPPASYASQSTIKIKVISKLIIDGGSPPTEVESLQGHEIVVMLAPVLELQTDEFLMLQSGENHELNG